MKPLRVPKLELGENENQAARARVARGWTVSARHHRPPTAGSERDALCSRHKFSRSSGLLLGASVNVKMPPREVIRQLPVNCQA